MRKTNPVLLVITAVVLAIAAVFWGIAIRKFTSSAPEAISVIPTSTPVVASTRNPSPVVIAPPAPSITPPPVVVPPPPSQPLVIVDPADSNLTPPAQILGYNLMFSDNFNSLSLSPGRIGNYIWYNPGMWGEIAAPDRNISASNGILTLNWTNDQGGGDTSIATAINASNTSVISWKAPFYAEARIALTPVEGSWPAFWFMPVVGLNVYYPPNFCELDAMEGQNDGITMSLSGTEHQNRYHIFTQEPDNNTYQPAVDLSQYHTYGVLLTSSTTTWYFDNQAMFSAPTYPDCASQSLYMILGSQMGADWTYRKNPAGISELPMYVDWVRVWQ